MPRDDATERILDAAIGLWAEKGYEAATMRQLARRVGMGASTLYRHFDSKEAIVQHFYVRLNEDVGAAFDVDGPSGDLGADLQRYLQLKIAHMQDHRSAMVGLLREAIDPESRLSPLHPESDRTLSANVERFTGWVERAHVASGDEARDLGRALWMLHLGMLVFWLHDRSEDQATTQQALQGLHGLAGMLPMARMLPQTGQFLGLLRRLFETRAAAPVEVVEAPQTDRQVDVVVMGGGPVGCMVAGFLKQMRPKAKVVVLERDASPGHKVGESTLSGFCKALRTLGVRQEAMQRLFQLKNGLGFSWVEEGHTLKSAPEYVLETFDETFQVERRVLDTLVMHQVRRLGVEVIQGAAVDLDALQLQAEASVVPYTIGRHQVRLGARWVVDATGPRAALARRQGLYTDDGIGFQTSAVWGWFEGVTPLSAQGLPKTTQFSRDEYTWHLCARPGWVWWIPQQSFADAPDANLQRAVDAVLTAGRLPDRAHLEQLGNPVHPRVSVGLVVRSDRDDLGLSADPAEAFAAARRRYGALDAALAGATPVDMGAGPFDHRKHMRGHARRVTGDGWLAVGDAAFFVDPLISPGLTAGAALAYRAATALAAGLAGTLREETFTAYEAFTHELHAALEVDNQLVYHSFDHPELMALVQRFQEITARQHFLDGASDYGEADTNVWGILDPTYAEPQRELLAILRTHAAAVDARVPVAEQTTDDYAPVVEQVLERFGGHLDARVALTPYVRAGGG
ncbi:MAG: tryptophan 7-halogenase [Myxococcales bacterium]|nr:tryptophan 7-halogenase [Myxococcales bacterium]